MYKNLFKIENLSYDYDALNSLKNLSFEVKSGEVLALIGDFDYNIDNFLNILSEKHSDFKGNIIFKDNVDR